MTSWYKNNKQIFKKSSVIEAPHAFSTKYSCMNENGELCGGLGYINAKPDILVRNWTLFSGYTGIDVTNVCCVKESHSANVQIVDNANGFNIIDTPICNAPIVSDCDGLITATKGLTLVVYTADCAPLLLHDKKANIAGAVHCGWKGFSLDIISNVIDKFRMLDSNVANIDVAIGPCINKCCFEVGYEIVVKFKNILGDDVGHCYSVSKFAANKYYLDLRKSIEIRLLQLGVLQNHIEHIDECTYCEGDLYYSHRRERGKNKSMASIIRMD